MRSSSYQIKTDIRVSNSTSQVLSKSRLKRGIPVILDGENLEARLVEYDAPSSRGLTPGSYLVAPLFGPDGIETVVLIKEIEGVHIADFSNITFDRFRPETLVRVPNGSKEFKQLEPLVTKAFGYVRPSSLDKPHDEPHDKPHDEIRASMETMSRETVLGLLESLGRTTPQQIIESGNARVYGKNVFGPLLFNNKKVEAEPGSWKIEETAYQLVCLSQENSGEPVYAFARWSPYLDGIDLRETKLEVKRTGRITFVTGAGEDTIVPRGSELYAQLEPQMPRSGYKRSQRTGLIKNYVVGKRTEARVDNIRMPAVGSRKSESLAQRLGLGEADSKGQIEVRNAYPVLGPGDNGPEIMLAVVDPYNGGKVHMFDLGGKYLPESLKPVKKSIRTTIEELIQFTLAQYATNAMGGIHW
jgi:hypothetical protein